MKKFNFEFTEQEVQLLLSALGELPAKHCINLILKINNLINKPSETDD